MKRLFHGRASTFVGCLISAALWTVGEVGLVHAAAIPKLFGTGLDETGALLGPEQIDPHYKLTMSPDPDATGPDTFTLTPGYPVGPWAAEGTASRWIAPQSAQGVGSAPGLYTYETTFDLTGLDPTTAVITGKTGTDDTLSGVRLNGNTLGGIVSAGFQTLRSFTIPAGSPFLPGLNTLEFDVVNGGSAPNPTGLRLDLAGRATGAGERPQIITPPTSQTVIVGDTVILEVEASGTAPLSYEWRFKDNPLPNGNTALYTIRDVKLEQAGSYTVRISNTVGQTNSPEAALTVLVPFPGIYNTGIADNRTVLGDGETDPHYQLVANADAPGASDSVAQINIPTSWVPNTAKSRWIGPYAEGSAAGGDYVYRLALNLRGYNPATAFLAGNWAADDSGALFLNGADTGFRSPGFGLLATFNLTNGFVSGTNLVEFRVSNSGQNPTGLRVENLRGTAQPQTTTNSAPRIVVQPKGLTNVITATGVTLTVVADGTPPLRYEWFHNGQPFAALEQGPSVQFKPLSLGEAGDYTVRVSNDLGSDTSDAAHLEVFQPEVGVFNTGVDSSGALLSTGQPDPHYLLIASSDSAFPGFTSFATGGPIPPWFANDDDSAWIAARPDESASTAPGIYRYRLIFFIDSASDVSTAALTANVGTDDGNGGIFLNGSPVEFGPSGFGELTPLSIPQGGPFVHGANALDFVVNNGGLDSNPSGLRVDDLMLTGVTPRPPAPALTVTRSHENIRIAWPADAAGFRLQESAGLPGGWADSAAAITVAGGEKVVVVPLSAQTKFFRLLK